jgi:hypothetical protein
MNTVQLQAIEGSDDLFLPIPDEIWESEDWRVGDVLVMEASRGSIRITNRSKAEREVKMPNRTAGGGQDAG